MHLLRRREKFIPDEIRCSPFVGYRPHTTHFSSSLTVVVLVVCSQHQIDNFLKHKTVIPRDGIAIKGIIKIKIKFNICNQIKMCSEMELDETKERSIKRVFRSPPLRLPIM